MNLESPTMPIDLNSAIEMAVQFQGMFYMNVIQTFLLALTVVLLVAKR